MRRAWSSRRVLLLGHGADQREGAGAASGFGFWFDHIGPIDSAMPSKRILGAQYRLCEAAGSKWRGGVVAKSPWRWITRTYRSRLAESFPVAGELGLRPASLTHSQGSQARRGLLLLGRQ